MSASNIKTLPSICLVGHTGKMAQFFSGALRKAGYLVRGVGENLDAAAVENLAASRIIMLCVPVNSLEKALESICPYLEATQLLVDITSVKTKPMHWMERAFPGSVIGTHPLFGPLPQPQDMKVALVRGSRTTDHDCEEMERLYRHCGCRSFWTSMQEHDRGVAFAQSLNFSVSAAFFSSLYRCEGVEPFLTPSFRRHLEAARKHLTVDKDMFCEFTAMNPEFHGALALYRDIVDEIAKGNLDEVSSQAVSWYAYEPAVNGVLPKEQMQGEQEGICNSK